mmetsp:Transcript_47425/g.106697  ORF Transcript_47425/g.106697 Transcript_47425/m.106697 type:complete len:242 (+) Transcript_47425:1106-1831(+)
MLSVHLLLLNGCALVDKLVQELLQHLDDSMGLELVPRGLWGRHCKAIWLLLTTLEEEVNGLLCRRRDEAEALEGRHLCERRCLRPVVGLLLEDSNGTLQGIDRLRVVLVQSVVVRFFHAPHFGGGLDVAVPDRNVLIMASNLLGEPCRIRGVLLDVSFQHVNFLVCLSDVPLLVDGSVIAELLICSKLHLLVVLFLLAVVEHTLEQRYHLLHRCHRGSSCAGPRRTGTRNTDSQEGNGENH